MNSKKWYDTPHYSLFPPGSATAAISYIQGAATLRSTATTLVKPELIYFVRATACFLYFDATIMV